MRLPKTWSDAIERGVVTTDMLDAAALTMHARATSWTRAANNAAKTLEKRPTAAATRRRYEHAVRMALKYSLTKQRLLETVGPTAVIRTGPIKNQTAFALFEIESRTYMCPIPNDEAEDYARRWGVSTTPVRKIRRPKYDINIVPSLHTVLNIMDAICVHGITTALRTGNFDPTGTEWTPKPIDWDDVDTSDVLRLGELHVEAMTT